MWIPLAYSSAWATVRRSSAWIAFLGLVLLAGCEADVSSTPKPVTSPGPAASFASPGGAPPYGLSVALDVSVLKERYATGNGVVLVFLREAGDRMPVAVRKYDLAQVPSVIEFSAGGPMPDIEVVARYSPMGKIDRGPDDVEATVLSSIGHPITQVAMSLPASAVTNASDSGVIHEIDVAVSLGEGVSGLAADTTVFVSARGEAGAIPVAVKRLSLADLPASVTLSDADAMLPSRNISSAAQVSVTAHVSVNGTPSREVGDFVSERVTVVDTSTPVQLVINQRVE